MTRYLPFVLSLSIQNEEIHISIEQRIKSCNYDRLFHNLLDNRISLIIEQCLHQVIEISLFGDYIMEF
jgi:hypothetical protein